MATAAGVGKIVALLMKRPITEEIAVQVELTEGLSYLEIEDGDWVGFDDDEVMAGGEHGWIETLLINAFSNWILTSRSGSLYPGDTDIVLVGTPDDIMTKRRPDVAFLRRSKVKRTKGYIYSAPDLAIEIIAPSEKPTQIRKKLHEYLDHGVLQVWQIYPDSQEIVVHLPDGTARTFEAGQVISGGDLLPGFSLDVAWVFQSPISDEDAE